MSSLIVKNNGWEGKVPFANKLNSFYLGFLYNLGLEKDSVFICGGFPLFLLNETNPLQVGDLDVDLFFKNELVFNIVKDKLDCFFAKNVLFQKKIESRYALTYVFNEYFLKNNKKKYTKQIAIQLIRPSVLCGNCFEDIFNAFDLTVCQIGIELHENHFHYIMNKETANDFKTKITRINKINNPFLVFKRLGKYEAKGFRAPVKEIEKIFEMWKNLDEKELTKLRNEADCITTKVTGNGVMYHTLNKKLHCETGPAIITNQEAEYYLEDTHYTKTDWKNKIRRKKIDKLLEDE